MAVMRRREVEEETAAVEGSAVPIAVSVLALPSAAHSSSVSVDMDMAEETERLKSTKKQLSIDNDILRTHGHGHD